MNEITEIDNRVNKVLEKIKEMESAFLEIQQPRTPFVLEKFVVGQHDTLETQYQQCVLEMQVKYDNIRRAKLNKKKILFKIAEYESKNSELDQIEADILKIDLEEQERAMLGAIREFETLYSIWQSFPNKYTREDIDKNQDGSVDVYFGPTKPTGSNRNYVKTIAGRGWFPYFRFYGPSEKYFDKTWSLEDIVEIK
jgi:hypothetical protein